MSPREVGGEDVRYLIELLRTLCKRLKGRDQFMMLHLGVFVALPRVGRIDASGGHAQTQPLHALTCNTLLERPLSHRRGKIGHTGAGGAGEWQRA